MALDMKLGFESFQRLVIDNLFLNECEEVSPNVCSKPLITAQRMI